MAGFWGFASLQKRVIRGEIRVLREQFGGSRVRLDDNQCRRVAVKLAKPVRTNWLALRLPEHPRVKFKPFRIPKFNLGEISMSRIQQHIPFPTDRRGWNKQGGAPSIPNPLVPESM